MQDIVFKPREFSNTVTFLRSDLKDIKNKLSVMMSLSNKNLYLRDLTQEELYNLDIRNFKIEDRLIKILKDQGIFYVHDLLELSQEDLVAKFKKCSASQIMSMIDFYGLTKCDCEKKKKQPSKYSLKEPICIKPTKFKNVECILDSDILDAYYAVNYLISLYSFKNLPKLNSDEYLLFSTDDLDKYTLLGHREIDKVNKLIKLDRDTLLLYELSKNRIEQIVTFITDIGLKMAENKAIKEKDTLKDIGCPDNLLMWFEDYDVYNVFELRCIEEMQMQKSNRGLSSVRFSGVKEYLNTKGKNITGSVHFTSRLRKLTNEGKISDIGLSDINTKFFIEEFKKLGDDDTIASFKKNYNTIKKQGPKFLYDMFKHITINKHIISEIKR